jgi:small subunit ribosomal protein S1
MVHMSDIAWGVSGEAALALHHKGEMVTAQVLEVDVERERISLGIKQVSGEGAGAQAAGETAAAGGREMRKNEEVTCIVRATNDGGIEVQIGEDGPTAFIKRSDLSRDRDEQRPERFQVGQKVDAMVVGFERGKKPMLSIKAKQIADDKQAVAQYGSSDSGASLGDILGAALNKAKQDS